MTNNLSILTWNIGGGFIYNHKTENFDNYNMSYFINLLEITKPDIICIQEIHPNQFTIIKKHLKISGAYIDISPSHFMPDSKLGLAIFSRHEILDSYYYLLPNPQITAIDDDGVYLTSFDNGFLRVTINWIKKINILCGHNLPFHRFHRDFMEKQFKDIRSELANIFSLYSSGYSIYCADLNYEDIEMLLPELSFYGIKSCLLDTPTTPSGKRLDYILASRHFHSISPSKVYNSVLSDHFPCICFLSINDQFN